MANPVIHLILASTSMPASLPTSPSVLCPCHAPGISGQSLLSLRAVFCLLFMTFCSQLLAFAPASCHLEISLVQLCVALLQDIHMGAIQAAQLWGRWAPSAAPT